MLNKSKLKVTINVEVDDRQSIDTSFYFGDSEEEKQATQNCINEIKARLNKNDVWAWCAVQIQVQGDFNSFKGKSNWLGGCSYQNEKDFIQNSGYYDDMINEAIENLEENLNHQIDLGKIAQSVKSWLQ